MRRDVALAGIVFSADDWAAYDPIFRAELMAAAASGADAWVMAPATGALSARCAFRSSRATTVNSRFPVPGSRFPCARTSLAEEKEVAPETSVSDPG